MGGKGIANRGDKKELVLFYFLRIFLLYGRIFLTIFGTKCIRKRMENFAAIDFETANEQRCSVCSVGVVVVRDGEMTDSFYSLIRPEPEYYTYWNTRVHGLTQADTERAPVFPSVWQEIAPRIEGLPLVAHNKAFDESCLKAVFRVYCMDYPDYDFHCTLQAARRVIKGLPDYQLHTVAACCGYQLKQHHHALSDAEACAWIARRVFG